MKKTYSFLLTAFVAFCLVYLVAQATARNQTLSSPPEFEHVESSSAIAELKRLVLAGDRNAIDEFWKRAKRIGTPVVENSGTDSHEVIVTFLWHGDPSTKSVGLLAPLGDSPGMPNLPLTRLLDTDVWYSSWRMRDDLRFSYSFVMNTQPGEKYSEQDVRTDPLNPHQMKIARDEDALTLQFSIAAMPRAHEPDCIKKQTSIPEGKVERQEFKSAILNNERLVWVYTPPGYDAKSHAAYPLLLLFDGFTYQSWIPAPTILDNLIHAKRVPAMIALLIGNAPESRMSELSYNPKFVDFVTLELLPWLHKHWRVTSDPQKTIIGGYSAGGAAAAFFALEKPDLFGKVLSQSGSFQYGNGEVTSEWLAHEYQSRPKLPIRFFVEAGRLENISRGGPSLRAANRDFVAVLREKNYAVVYEEVGGTHEPAHWRGEFGKAIISVMK
jgi:enterochelin esterase-like enzyme